MKIFRIITSSRAFVLDDGDINNILKDIETELSNGETLPNIMPALAKRYNVPGTSADATIFRMIKDNLGAEKLKEIKERSLSNYRSGKSRKKLNDAEKEKTLESFEFYIKEGLTIKEIEARQNKDPITFERFVTENFGPEMYKKLNKSKKIKSTSFKNLATAIKENTDHAIPKSITDVFYFIKTKLDEGHTLLSISRLLKLNMGALAGFIQENFPDHITWLKNKSKQNRKIYPNHNTGAESILGESPKTTNSLPNKWIAFQKIKSDPDLADQIEDMHYVDNKTAEEISKELGLNLNAIIQFLHV